MAERYFGKKPKILLNPEVIQNAKDYARLAVNGCYFGGAFYEDKNEFSVDYTFLFDQIKPAYSGTLPTLDMSSWDSERVKLGALNIPSFSPAFIGIATSDITAIGTLNSKEIEVLTKSIGTLYNRAIYLKVNKSGEISVGIIDFENQYLFENIGFEVDTAGFGDADSKVRDALSKHVKAYAGQTTNYNNNTNYNNTYKGPEPYKEADINIKNPELIALTGDKMEFNYDGFKLLCAATQENLRKYFSKRLLELYGEKNTTVTEDYIFCKGQLPTMLVAHMDTVHKTLPGKIFYDKDLGEIYSPDGIGGDDRCGIYGVISVLMAAKGGKLPSVLFTMNEEIGCLGAKTARYEIKKKIFDVNFMIELDRHGKDHAVYYNTTNPDFVEHISKYGFSVEIGMGSDVKYLSDEWNVASANLAIGYYNEHTLKETVVVGDMMSTIRKTKKIVDDSPKTNLFIQKKTTVLSPITNVLNLPK